jgi:hypothetical protein
VVAVAPRLGAWVVAAWLCGIIVDLVTGPGFYDVALRDFGLLIGALALARLAQGVHSGSIRGSIRGSIAARWPLNRSGAAGPVERRHLREHRGGGRVSSVP